MTNDLAPHSVEAETALLGGILIAPELISRVRDILGPDDFFIRRYQWIFKVICDLDDEKQKDIDVLTISNELDNRNQLVEVGGLPTLTSLINSTPSAMNAESHALIVKEKAVRRRMLKGANKMANMAVKEDKPLDQILTDVTKTWDAVVKGAIVHDDGITIRDAVSDQLNEWDRMAQGKSVWTNTGYPSLDAVLGGLQAPDFVLYAGRPSAGKTSMLLDTARANAREGKRVIIFSMEMSSKQITNRLVAMEAGIDSQNIRQGRLTDQEQKVYGKAIENIVKWNVIIDDTPRLTPEQIRARLARYSQDGKIDLILVDYIQLMEADGFRNNRTQEISFISRQLKLMAKEYGIIIAGAQLNRAVEQRTDKRPILSDLRESGSLEQDSDIVVFVHRPDGKLMPAAEFLVDKNRNGPLGDCSYIYQKAYCRFVAPPTEQKDHWAK